MFVAIQNDIVNVNHIVSCTTGSGMTIIILSNERRLTIPASVFEANVLPLLPMLKPTQDIVILPTEEVQVDLGEQLEPAHMPDAQFEKVVKAVETALPKSRRKS